MYEALTILICLAFKYFASLTTTRNKRKFDQALLELKPYVPPKNQEIEALKARKAEIESTIEQFNTPSTFAKYSKMQRELLKIDRQVEEILKKSENEGETSRKKYEAQQEEKKAAIEKDRSNFNTNQKIIRIVVNVILVRLMSSYYSQAVGLCQNWPLSIFCSEEGRINCGWIMLAGNLLISFD